MKNFNGIKFNAINELLEFLDSDYFVVYNRLKRYSNQTIFTTEDTSYKHPLYDYSWENIKTLAERLSIGSVKIIKSFEDLISLGLISKYRYDDTQNDLQNKITEFNEKTVCILNNYYKQKAKEKNGVCISQVYPFNQNFFKNKSFYKLNDVKIKNYEFKFKILLETRRALRHKSKTANLSIEFVKRIISEEFNIYLENKEWERIVEFINHNLKLNIVKNNQFTGKIDLEAIRKVYLNYLHLFGVNNSYVYSKNFNESIESLKNHYSGMNYLEYFGDKIFIPDVDNKNIDLKEHINEFLKILGLIDMINVINITKELFWFLLETMTNMIPKKQVLLSWLNFKKKYPNFRKMNTGHIVRSLRLFLYYQVKDNLESIKVSSNNKKWYYVQKRTGNLEIPQIYKQYINITMLEKLKFFKQNYFETKSGKLIPPFYFVDINNKKELAKDKIYPNWVELIETFGKEEKEVLYNLLKELKPALIQIAEYYIEMDMLKEVPEIKIK